MALRFRIQTTPSRDSATMIDRRVAVEARAGEIRIGRRAGLELELPFETISGLHARVHRRGGGWAIADLGSSNGTFIGDRRLPPHTAAEIAVGATIRLANVHVTFEDDSDDAAASAGPLESTGTIARRLVNDIFQALGGVDVARVLVLDAAGEGARLSLGIADRPYKVGRAPSCDLVLADDDASREHASFTRTWQGVLVRDLSSKNGVEVAGSRILGDRRLQDGEELVIGTTRLRFEDPEERYLRRMQAEDAPESVHPTPLLPSDGDQAAAFFDRPSADVSIEPMGALRSVRPPAAAAGRRPGAAAMRRKSAVSYDEARAAGAWREREQDDPGSVVPVITGTDVRAAARLDEPASLLAGVDGLETFGPGGALDRSRAPAAERRNARGESSIQRRRPSGRQLGPALLSAIASLVLAAVVGLAFWLFLGGS